MHLLEWNEDLCVGVNAIDEEHKVFFRLFNTLYEAIQFGKAEEVLHPLFDGLITYTVTHFTHEEEYMFTSKYPGFAEHKEAHDHLRARVMELQKRSEEDGFSVDLSNELFAFMKSWLTHHVLSMDKTLAVYLKEHGFH